MDRAKKLAKHLRRRLRQFPRQGPRNVPDYQMNRVKKTFVNLGHGRYKLPGSDSQKFFAPLFFKKAAASSP
jgi:hypothetical protein